MTSTAILLPYYNNPTGLARTLESLRSEPEAFELYIVDDGSSPPLVLNTKYPFPVHVMRLANNSGIEAALNAGLEKILSNNHTFIARMDTGDLWLAGRLAAQRNFLLAHPDCIVVGSWAIALGENGKEKFTVRYPSDDTAIRRSCFLNSPFCHVAVMLRAGAVREAGNYPVLYPAAEDYAFFWNLLRYGKGANLPQVWVKYEITATVPSISYQQRRQQLLSRRRIQIAHFQPRQMLSWWGVLCTTLLLYLPYPTLLRLKSWLWRR